MGHSTEEQGATKEIDIRSLSSSRRHTESVQAVRKVGVPPKQNLFKEFAATFKETFFADDPLRPFKDQPKSRKFILGVQALFPIFEWGRHYNLSKFKGDLIAGLTIASLCIPQDIGYAKLANLDPQYGLYSSFVPPLVYAFMGSSRDIAIGPVAVVSLLLGTLLRDEIDPVTNAAEYRRLAFTATFFAGITQASLGFLRLGFLIDFLSHAAVVGFMGGAAITISLQQLKGFLGIKNFTKKTDIVSVMHSVFDAAHHGWNWQTIVIGASFLSFLLFAKFIGKKNKKLFWVPAIAPLISVILSTFFVYITHAEKQGVQIVRHLEKGINPPSIHQIYFNGENLLKGIRIGVIAGMIGLTEAVAIGRTFAAMKDYQLDGNKEMVALGAMNVVGSMTSCYVATGSFSRSAVNYMAGCQTAVSNIVMSCVVFLTLEFITPLFKYTPNAILAAIIISAVIGLIDFEAAVLIWKIDKFDFFACMGAFFGVVFSSVEIGLLVAVSISFAKILLQVTRPRTALLGKIPRTTVYRNIQQYPDASKVPGVLIVRVDSAIYFSNSNYIRERVLRWLTDEEDIVKANDLPKIQFLIVDMSPVTDIDTSGIHAMEELNNSLLKRDVQLVLANPGPVVIDKLHASSFANLRNPRVASKGKKKKMLRVAGRRLSSLPWRSSQATSAVFSQSYPVNDGVAELSPSRSIASQNPLSFNSELLRLLRGFSSEALIQGHDMGISDLPATVAAVKNPTSNIVYDDHNHERYPPGDPSKRAFAYFVLTGGRFVYASLIRLLVLKFVLSMSASKDVLALASLEVDLSSVEPGTTVTVKWRGKPVFIRRRTEEDIKLANSVDVGSLRDPQDDSARVKNPEWLVVVGVCTHLGCIPLPNAGDFGGWFCPCHGSHYDISGRIRKGPAPFNLEVPTYTFLEENKLLIG